MSGTTVIIGVVALLSVCASPSGDRVPQPVADYPRRTFSISFSSESIDILRPAA